MTATAMEDGKARSFPIYELKLVAETHHFRGGDGR
jgi:hypothetical protein